MIEPRDLDDLVRLVDRLEDQAENYVTLDQLEVISAPQVARAIAEGILLVDHRTRLDARPVTLCRLNRHHPLVVHLTSW